MTENKFLVDENYIMWGFRYALGRKTGAILDVVDALKRLWPFLSDFTKNQIKDEIKNYNEAIYGSLYGKETWGEILEL